MINIHTEIHDKFSIEFKIGYNNDDNVEINEFSVNTWIFIPPSLNINPHTYPGERFYRDLNTKIRLITPVFALGEIADGDMIPLKYLSESLLKLLGNPDQKQIENFEYNVKMFAAIFKSALRNHINRTLCTSDRKSLTEQLINHLSSILSKFRLLHKEIEQSPDRENFENYFLFADEFMSDLVYRQLFRVVSFLRLDDPQLFEQTKELLLTFIENELKYRDEKGYNRIDIDSKNQNRNLVYRSGLLKKYIESELFLNVVKKKDARFVEQIYLSLAAGVSMVFATAVAFLAQLRYGSITIPLFVALVISYMLKDRIKELMRYYFAHKLKHKYFDNKTKIDIGKGDNIGVSKEGMDFISEDKVPQSVIEMRGRTPLLEADNKISGEKIILFRKYVKLNRQALSNITSYNISGINEIMRLNLSSFTQKMDDPYTPLYVLRKDGEYDVMDGSKVYYLNFVMQFTDSTGNSFFKHYRAILNRKGIQEVVEVRS